ncbi:MAG: hypothetical protein ACLR23_23610 [Clostridia bacterium]
MAGVIQKINENPDRMGGYYTDESSQAYITILRLESIALKGQSMNKTCMTSPLGSRYSFGRACRRA